MLSANTETGLEINKLTKQINRLQEQTAFWRLKTQQNYRECKDRDDQLRKEKVTIVKHYHDLKRKMANQRNEKDNRLGTLSTNSLACMETLKGY